MLITYLSLERWLFLAIVCVNTFFFFFFSFFPPWKESRMKQQTFSLKPCLAQWKRKGACESWLPEGLRAHKSLENKLGERAEITWSFLWYMEKAEGNRFPHLERLDWRIPWTTQPWEWLIWSFNTVVMGRGMLLPVWRPYSKDERCWSCTTPAPSPGSHLLLPAAWQ